MKTLFEKRNLIVSILGVLLFIYGAQGLSYAQEANPTITASTPQPLTEATLHGSVLTLKLSEGWLYTFSDIEDALTISGIDDVSFDRWDVDHSSNEVSIQLAFNGDFDTDATLTIEVGEGALLGYNGPALTAQLSVTAVEESLIALTDAPLTEPDLQGSVITLKLTGRHFVRNYYLVNEYEDHLTISGIEGVTVSEYGLRRISNTEATVELAFTGNIDADATLNLTVGADAIVGYNKDFTVQLPVTAVEESLTATTEAPMTEANLDVNVITLSLSGRKFVGFTEWGDYNPDTLTLSGIKGVTVYNVIRISDTEVKVNLTFSGDFDTDAILTLTVGANAIGYNKDLTFNFPVTAIEQSDATVSISPTPIALPAIGEKLTLNLNITNGKNVAGYQATVGYDPSVLRYTEGGNGNYLPVDAFFKDPIHPYNSAVIAGNTLAEASSGDGTLATLTFEVIDYKPFMVTLSDVYLVDSNGKRWEVTTENGEILEPSQRIFGDLNLDGVVNIQDLVIVSAKFGLKGRSSADVNGDGLVDIVDLVLVANAFGANAAAPSLNPQILEQLTAADVKEWLTQAQKITLTDPDYKRGITVLQQLHKALIPKTTALLPNFPNPFNPETWIPYHLAKDADVTLHIYAMNGPLVRTLTLGHQAAGLYQNRSRAAYWDGKNEFGEKVATGVYFYTLTAGDFSATRKMLIRK